MKLIIMNLATNTISTLLVGYFLSQQLDKGLTYKKKTVLSLIALIIFNTLVTLIFPIISIVGFIIIFTISIVVYAYLLEENLAKLLIYGILGAILMFLLEMITANLILIVFSIDPSKIIGLSIYRNMAIIISRFAFYLIIKCRLVKFKIPKHYKLDDTIHIVLIGIFNVLIIFMTFTLYKHVEKKSLREYIYLSAMTFASLIFSWIIYRIIQKMIYQSWKEKIWKMREAEFLQKDSYIKNADDILHTIRSQRHDLNNYLSTLYGLVYLERFEEAKKYITEINNRMDNMNNIVETNHPVITVLVTTKKNKALEENIELSWDINLPSDFPFDFVDLSIIIGNLLDNAIEACQLVKEGLRRKIELSIYVEDEKLVIELANTKSESIKVNSKKLLDRYTSKSDRENHGYGLGNIEYIVKEHNGSMDMEDLGDRFTTYIELFLGGCGCKVSSRV